jgi:hypothetical protein
MSAAPRDSSDADDKQKHTTDTQRALMCSFVETPSNLASIIGCAASGKPVTGMPLKKIDGFREMAAYVNAASGSDWTAKIAQSRFGRYKAMYLTTKKLTMATGWGLHQEDYAQGIRSLPAKLDSLCPCFDRMDHVFGKRQNVEPSHLRHIGYGGPPKQTTRRQSRHEQRGEEDHEPSQDVVSSEGTDGLSNAAADDDWEKRPFETEGVDRTSGPSVAGGVILDMQSSIQGT